MSKFLDDFLITMPDTQRKKLLELLEIKRQEGILLSDLQLQQEFQRILSDLQGREGGPTFQARHQSGIADSKSYNDNLEEIALDLATLFAASESIDRLILDNKHLARSLLSSIQKKIQTLTTDLERYKLRMQNTEGFTDGVYEQFKLPELTETYEDNLKVFRKERFGQYLNNTYEAENVGDALQLAGIETYDQLKDIYGRKLANIKVLNRIGSVEVNKEHDITKAIDGSLDTFWAEAVLSDEPIVQDITNLWPHNYEVYPKDGAIAELEITLNGVTTVSDIHFDPYCSYPLEIVSIYGYETEEHDSQMYELITPNHPNIHQRSKKSTTRMSFQFPSVDISRLRILIRQENYIKENYLVNADDARNQEIWEQLTTDPEIIEDYKDPNETMASFNRKMEKTGWMVYLEKLKEWATNLRKFEIIDAAKTAMEVVRKGDFKNPLLLALQALNPENQEFISSDKTLSQKWIAVNKMSYVYGAYDISIFGRKYQNKSIYVSKPLPLSSNAIRLGLTTDEKHHDVEIDNNNTARITDIEYYITYKKNPTIKDWIPILPSNKQYVQGELLLGDMGGKSTVFEDYESTGKKLITYSLRFPIVSNDTVVVRRNGMPISTETYLISEDGKRIGIKQEYYSAASVYTADYKTDDNAYLVEIDDTKVYPIQYLDENGETGEYFAKPDQNNALTLKNKPYLYRSSVFQYNKEGKTYEQNQEKVSSDSITFPVNVRVNGVEFMNITDYTTNSYNDERLKENDGKTFAQIGNRIVLGQPIDGMEMKDITVDYHYLATDIRLKAILRRNSTEHESITPALYSYKIQCQSFDQEE